MLHGIHGLRNMYKIASRRPCARGQRRGRNSAEIGVWVQKGPCELAKRLAEDNLRGWLQCWFGNLMRTSTTKPKGAEGQYTKIFGSQATTWPAWTYTEFKVLAAGVPFGIFTALHTISKLAESHRFRYKSPQRGFHETIRRSTLGNATIMTDVMRRQRSNIEPLHAARSDRHRRSRRC